MSDVLKIDFFLIFEIRSLIKYVMPIYIFKGLLKLCIVYFFNKFIIIYIHLH